MNRRTFVAAASCAPLFVSSSVFAESQGIKIRFVITRSAKTQDTENRSTLENAILLAPNERFQGDFTKDYRLALRPVTTSEGIRVEATLIDLALYPAIEMSGQALIQMGQGGSITFRGPGPESYALGLLITAQRLPKSAA